MKAVLLIALLNIIMVSQVAGQIKVALFNFENKSEDGSLDRWEELVPDLLRARLAEDDKLILLERENIDKLFDEYKLSLSGITDSSAAENIGQLTGADFLISGSIHRLGDKFWIDVNLTKVKTAEMSLEQVTAYDRRHVNEMSDLLATNIRNRLGTFNEYREKIKLKKFPTTIFALATVGLGATSIVYHKKYQQNYDKYQNSEELKDFDNYYDSAKQAKDIRNITAALAGLALTGTIYCWVHNKSIHNIVAFSEKTKILPQVEIDKSGVSAIGIQIFF